MHMLRDGVAVSAEIRTAVLRVLREAMLAATSDVVRALCRQPTIHRSRQLMTLLAP